MKDTSNSQSPRQDSRRKSLRYHTEQEKPEIPAYLKAVSASEEEEALLSSKTYSAESAPQKTVVNNHSQGGITINMDRTSIFSIIFGCMLLGLCFFAMGFATSYVFFQSPAPAKIVAALEKKAQPEVSAATDTPAPSNEGERLAQMAQSLAGKLADEKAPGADVAKAKISEALAAKSAAENLKEETEKALKELPANLRENANIQAMPASTFEIDLGLVSSQEQGKEMQLELKKVNIEARLFVMENKSGLPVYRLRTGNFKTYEDANNFIATLAKPYSLWASVANSENNSDSTKVAN